MEEDLQIPEHRIDHEDYFHRFRLEILEMGAYRPEIVLQRLLPGCERKITQFRFKTLGLQHVKEADPDQTRALCMS